MKILDSDHCIAILRGTLDLRHRAAPEEQLGVTAISVGELAHGAGKSADPDKNLARVNLLLSAVRVLPFDEGAALRFGALKSDLERRGTRLGDLDLQIAGIVMEHDAILLTHNAKHFERIPAPALADWMQ